MSNISVRNVTRVFRLSTPENLAAGLAWYEDAHTIADALAAAHGVPVSRVAGILSAFSPRNSWGSNVNAAARFIKSQGTSGGHTKANVTKALAILLGADNTETLRGLKTVAFASLIESAGMSGAVCIDRHAYDIAANVRHTDDTRNITPKRFRACVDAYNGAACILSRELGYPVTGAQVQAVTWLTWRARYWATGAFDFKGYRD